jgi:uncharacterized alkaline shock family protein YloU
MTELARTAIGRITVSPEALCRVVVRTAEEVEGVEVRRQRRNPRVEISAGSARVEVSLSVRRGTIVPAAARAVQECVSTAVAAMLEVRVEAVDVSVERILR